MLLGESLDLISRVGTDCWFLYSLLRGGQEYLDSGWDISNDVARGDALVCVYDFSDWRHHDIFAKVGDVAGLLITLRAEEWVYDWRVEGEMVYAVVGFYDGHVIYALDSLVHRDRLVSIRSKPIPRVVQHVPNERLERIRKSVAKQKEDSDVVKERNDRRLLVRLQKKWADRYGYSGDDWGDARWRDASSPFGVSMNLQGMWHLYEMLFEKDFSRKASLYTRGKPNKAAYKLKAIADEYGIEYAMAAIVYAIANWDEIKKLTRTAKPPAPGVIWGFRHELCHPLTQGEDPIEELRKVKGGKETLESRIRRDEYGEDENEDEDKGVGW